MKNYKILILIFTSILIGNCGTINIGTQTPQRTYYEAQVAFINATDTYYSAWMMLPESDSRKKEWVEKYHPKFIDAGKALLLWGNGEIDPNDADELIKIAENILIQLAIKEDAK